MPLASKHFQLRIILKPTCGQQWDKTGSMQIMLLPVHKSLTDNSDLKNIATEFQERSDYQNKKIQILKKKPTIFAQINFKKEVTIEKKKIPRFWKKNLKFLLFIHSCLLI